MGSTIGTVTASAAEAIENKDNVEYLLGSSPPIFIIRIIIFLSVLVAAIILMRMLPKIIRGRKDKKLLKGYKTISPHMSETQVRRLMNDDYLDSFNKDGTYSFTWKIVKEGRMSFASSNGVLGGVNGFRDGSGGIIHGETTIITVFFDKDGRVTDKKIINT